MGKKTVRGHDIANRFVYSLRHHDRDACRLFTWETVNVES